MHQNPYMDLYDRLCATTALRRIKQTFMLETDSYRLCCLNTKYDDNLGENLSYFGQD